MIETPFYPDPADPAVEARIYDSMELMVLRSRDAGHEVRESRPFIEIRVKGQGDISRRPLQENDTKRFPFSWQAYKGEAVVVDSGTPISKLPDIGAEQVDTLLRRGIRSIEDLAYASEGVVQNLGFGMPTLQRKSREFLGGSYKAKAEAAIESVEAVKDKSVELEARMDRIEKLLLAMTERPTQEEKPAKREKLALKSGGIASA